MSSSPEDSKQDPRSIPQTVREAWMNVLGVFTSAEHKLMESLGLNPEAPLGAELLARVRKNREEFERRIDEGVRSAVAKVRAPIDKEVASLKTRIEHIQERVEQLKKKRQSGESEGK